MGLFHALPRLGIRPFSRWLTRDYRALFLTSLSGPGSSALQNASDDWTQVSWPPQQCSGSSTVLS